MITKFLIEIKLFLIIRLLIYKIIEITIIKKIIEMFYSINIQIIFLNYL